jgi:hypothetical protein
MQHFFKLFLLVLLLLNFVTPAQKLQANHSDWIARQIDNPVFSQQDSNSGYPQVTVTTGQFRSQIPSPMAGKSNLSATLQNYKFVPIPDFKTGTIQEFENYLIAVKCTPENALGWHVAYMSNSYIAIIENLPGYGDELFDLKRKLSKKLTIAKLGDLFTGTHVNGLTERVAQLCQNFERKQLLRQKQKIAAIKQARQKSQVMVRQAWPENFVLLQQDVPEWQELSEIFLEHKFGDSARLQKRIVVLSQRDRENNFITQSYKITPQVENILHDAGLSRKAYAKCYGNPFQQLIHQENLDQLQQLGTLSPLSPIFYHKSAITECVDSAHEYNQAGLVHDSVKVTDMCWAIIDYGKAVFEGAAQGLIMVAKDLVDHPEQALLLVVAGEYVLAYQLAKVTYEVAKIGVTALTDLDQGNLEWDNYIAPVTELVDAFENNEITARDTLRTGTMLAVSCRAQGKLSNGLGKLCKVTKANALTYLKNNPHAAPQLYMSTPDGKLFKAAGEVAKTCPASCPIQYKNLKLTLNEQEFTSIIKVTKHGLQRLIERNFTPQEVLSLIKEPHYLKIQSDGAKVFIQNIDNKYKIIVFNETTNELVTALKGINKKQVLNIAKNHGWTL